MAEIERMSVGSWGASLLCLTACAHSLAACTTDVAIFTAQADRSGGGVAGRAATSTNVLLTPTSVRSADVNCAPGHYVGAFNGMYFSAVWMSGAMPLSIAATPSFDRPGLEFWLERVSNDCAFDAEFCADYTVKGGKIRGFANPFSSTAADAGVAMEDPSLFSVRFEIDFAGDLDCTRGKFLGLLKNGCYDLAGVLFYFEGDAPANYDAASSSFTNGQWNVKELPSNNALFPSTPNLGGMGNWQASLADDGVDPVAQSGFCVPQ
jgi:hypothetical protein